MLSQEKKRIIEFSVCLTISQRLDQYLSYVLAIPREQCKQAIKTGCVQVNGALIKKPALKLYQRDCVMVEIISQSQDDLVYHVEYEPNSFIRSDDFDVPIIFEDEHILIVNKPYGLVVHPAPTVVGATLTDLLSAAKIPLAMTGDSRPGIVHRLDQYTEGLLLIAKSDLALASLQHQFRDRTVGKKYYAVVVGVLAAKDGIIDKAIGRDISVRARQSCNHYVSGTEKSAITHYSVLYETTTVSFVDIDLITGRTHQIRVHFSAMNCPVLGDSLYSQQKQREDGYYLQSYQLSFCHPMTKKDMIVSIDVSDRLKEYTKNK